MGGDIAGQQSKKEAVGRPPMKKDPVPLNQKSQNDIHIRQIGQQAYKCKGSPSGTAGVAILNGLVCGKTDCGMS
jgi:hypothetical protein